MAESKIESYCQINACVTVPKNTYLPNYRVVYEDGGKIRVNEEFNEDVKKNSVKELSQFLSYQLPKWNKVREP